MKTYYVIKHDARLPGDVNGCHVSEDAESFRAVPVTAVIWTAKVRAQSKAQAVELAKKARGN